MAAVRQLSAEENAKLIAKLCSKNDKGIVQLINKQGSLDSDYFTCLTILLELTEAIATRPDQLKKAVNQRIREELEYWKQLPAALPDTDIPFLVAFLLAETYLSKREYPQVLIKLYSLATKMTSNAERKAYSFNMLAQLHEGIIPGFPVADFKTAAKHYNSVAHVKGTKEETAALNLQKAKALAALGKYYWLQPKERVNPAGYLENALELSNNATMQDSKFILHQIYGWAGRFEEAKQLLDEAAKDGHAQAKEIIVSEHNKTLEEIEADCAEIEKLVASGLSESTVYARFVEKLTTEVKESFSKSDNKALYIQIIYNNHACIYSALTNPKNKYKITDATRKIQIELSLDQIILAHRLVLELDIENYPKELVSAIIDNVCKVIPSLHPKLKLIKDQVRALAAWKEQKQFLLDCLAKYPRERTFRLAYEYKIREAVEREVADPENYAQLFAKYSAKLAEDKQKNIDAKEQIKKIYREALTAKRAMPRALDVIEDKVN